MTGKYRYYLSIGDLKAAKTIKDSSEFITASVICSGGRTLKHVVSHTSVLMGDIDKLTEGAAEQLVTKLKGDPHVLLAHKTLSGGVHLFFPVDIADKNLHAVAYRQGMAYFEQLLCHPLDGQCKNLTRTANLCYDPDAYYHPDAVPLHIDIADEVKKAVGRPRKVYHAAVSEAIPVVLESLAGQGKVYEPGHHNEFISCAVYQMNNFGVSSEQASEWVRTEYPEFDAAELKTIIRSVYEQHSDEYGKLALPGEKKEYKKSLPIEDIEQFINSQANIRYNTILDRREVRFFDEEAGFRDMVDRDENTIWKRMQSAGINCNPYQTRCILNSEFIGSFNPLTDYLNGLPEWDGVTDYIGQVAAMVHTENDEAFREHFRKWFVSIIASILKPDTVNNTILVLIGKQGIYKTTFFKKLLPPNLIRYYYTKVNSGQMNKDDIIALAEYILICLEEIDNMRTSELNRFKAMVTLPSVNERAPFAHNRIYRPHLASLCGTGNNRQFLIDDTENRRWLPAFVNSIDNPFTTKIPYEGLYAQAYALFQNGFNYYFDNEEMAKLQLHNQDFEEPNLEEELICSYFRVPVSGETGIFMSTADILERIGCVIKQPLSKQKISRAMGKLKFRHVHTMNSRGFLVVPLKPEERTARQCVIDGKTTEAQKDLPFKPD